MFFALCAPFDTDVPLPCAVYRNVERENEPALGARFKNRNDTWLTVTF
jgi:hypothetical protein